jgi:hypothetical protein
MKELSDKKEIILHREMAFANAVGASVLDKPKVSIWMVLIPILLLHFIYRMQSYKGKRLKFSEEFMITRRRALDIAHNTALTGDDPDISDVVRKSSLSEPLQKPYAAWVTALVDYYLDLLAAEGASFESLVRAAYSSRSNYLLTLNRLSVAEKTFYKALAPHLAATEGAAEIISKIESHSQELRLELADHVFR